MFNRSPAEWIAAGRAALAFVAFYAITMGAWFALTSCATIEQRAETAAIGDSVSTVAALAAGATEVNPLGLLTIPAKVGALMYARTLPDDERAEFHAVAGPIWGGAAANNLCVLATILTYGAATVPCIAVGIAYAAVAWQQSAPEREFYAACNEYRRVDLSVKRCEWVAQQ